MVGFYHPSEIGAAKYPEAKYILLEGCVRVNNFSSLNSEARKRALDIDMSHCLTKVFSRQNSMQMNSSYFSIYLVFNWCATSLNLNQNACLVSLDRFFHFSEPHEVLGTYDLPE